MVIGNTSLDWTYVRAFLAVAETGSLSAAARTLGQSQPTLGRHIKAAEAALGATLFVREPGGLQLTEIGRILLGPAQEMAAASARLETLAAGRDMRVSGTVRITASVVLSHFLLPRIIAALRDAEPDIDVELVPSDTTENLIFREADIAIRMFRPTQLEMVTRKIGDSPMALYASGDLLSRFGQPANFEELRRLPFVGFDRSDMILRQFREWGLDVTKAFFLACDAMTRPCIGSSFAPAAAWGACRPPSGTPSQGFAGLIASRTCRPFRSGSRPMTRCTRHPGSSVSGISSLTRCLAS